MEKGKLYICPTPIGNLEDITIRTLKILEKVDLIAAEDTRRSIKLLNHYDIKNKLTSYHEHNEKEKSKLLVEKLLEGKDIAQISDAGMPGISDPGERLIKKAIEAGIEIVVLPGATALITALVGSGLDTRRFFYEGFLPSKKRDRISRLKELAGVETTLILYESPHRIKDTLKDMQDVLGNRKISAMRELTKLYEEAYRSDIIGLIETFSKTAPKGEFVLIVEGGEEEQEAEKQVDIEWELEKLIEEGFTKKSSVKIVAEKYGLAKNDVYKKSLEL